MDLPLSVLQLIKSYDVSALRWESAEDRYAIVREILDRGSLDARTISRRADSCDFYRTGPRGVERSTSCTRAAAT
jgi:hypothetical protein